MVTLLLEEGGLQNENENGVVVVVEKKKEGWRGVEQSSGKRLFRGNQGLQRSSPTLLVPS